MSKTIEYDIKEGDIFCPANYPEIVGELSALMIATVHLPVLRKKEIIVSFYKNHSISNAWHKANPQIASLIVSGYYPGFYVERLFNACRKHLPFCEAFEAYIEARVMNTRY